MNQEILRNCVQELRTQHGDYLKQVILEGTPSIAEYDNDTQMWRELSDNDYVIHLGMASAENILISPVDSIKFVMLEMFKLGILYGKAESEVEFLDKLTKEKTND